MNIYYEKFKEFFKRHGLYDEKIFDELSHDSEMFDYLDDEKKTIYRLQLLYL